MSPHHGHDRSAETAHARRRHAAAPRYQPRRTGDPGPSRRSPRRVTGVRHDCRPQRRRTECRTRAAQAPGPAVAKLARSRHRRLLGNAATRSPHRARADRRSPHQRTRRAPPRRKDGMACEHSAAKSNDRPRPSRSVTDWRCALRAIPVRRGLAARLAPIGDGADPGDLHGCRRGWPGGGPGVGSRALISSTLADLTAAPVRARPSRLIPAGEQPVAHRRAD